MDIPEIELVLSRDISGIIHEYLGITEQYINKSEEIIFQKYNSRLTLLLTEDEELLGLFTTRESAIKYMIRDAINECLYYHNDYDKKIFNENVEQYISENYELITFTNKIDINQTIYVNSNFSNKQRWLTNSLDEWKKNCTKYKKCATKSDKDSLIKKCIVKIDPEIDKLEEWGIEDLL